MKKYSKELNYFNAIACIGVILVHILSIGITNLDRTSIELFIVYIPWKISTYVVPAFLFSGAVKMAFSFEGEGEGYFKYILKRIVKIYLPYCFWVVVYYLYFLAIGWVEKGFEPLFKYILIGDLSAQFYYVVIVMQFYFLQPLWKFIVNKIPFYVAIPTSALITVFMYRFENLLSYFGIAFEHRSRLFLSYLIFWVIGLYVGKHYEKIKESILKNKISVIFAIVPVLLTVTLSWWQHSKMAYIFDGDFLKLFTDILTILVLFAISLLIEVKDFKILKKPLTFIHKASFSVFLSHCLVLQIVTNGLKGIGITDTAVLILARAVACYTLPFILWFIYYKIKKIFAKKTVD